MESGNIPNNNRPLSNVDPNVLSKQKQIQRINLSPNYKKKINFTKATSPTNSNGYVNTGGNLSRKNYIYTVEDEDDRYNNYNQYNRGHTTLTAPNTNMHSTRNTSANFHTDENYNLKERLNNKKHYLNDSNLQAQKMNKTVIHYGENEMNNFKMKKISVISDMSRRNSPNSVCKRNEYLDTIYCMTESNRSNITTKAAQRLHEWLCGINMQSYYNNFLENGLHNIDRMISLMQDETTRVDYKDLEGIGIRKPGHIYRILVRLEIDARVIDEGVCKILLENHSRSVSISNNMPNFSLKVSSEKNVCCGFTKTQINTHKTVDLNLNRYDLINWLKIANVSQLRKNFLHNGFDSVEYLIIQMFSSFPFDDQLIEDCLHIYNKKERKLILSQLNKDIVLTNQRLLNKDNSLILSDGGVKMEKERVDDGCQMCLIF
jgi:hypothetical protein